MDVLPSALELLHAGPATNFVFLGEAGCGKSEIALNTALLLAKQGARPVHFFDLDMTKPLFRSRDCRKLLEDGHVMVHYEEQFMDAPTLTGGVRQRLLDPNCCAVLDVGGDYIGARSIGGYAPLLNRDETVVFYVINPFRPWSATLEHIDKVLGETLGVSHVELDRLRLVGNPNLGPGTTPRDVAEGARRLVEMVGPYKPVDFFCVQQELCPQLSEPLPGPAFPIRLHLTYPWDSKEKGDSLLS